MAKYLVEYKPPSWAQHLKNVPTHKVELAMENTPIHEWNLPGIPDGFSLHIKRHDMTGSSLSGNKVGKLEFLLADAILKGCKHVITCGTSPSNHCRALALACRQLGLVPHLFLTMTSEDLGCRGNILLDRLSGADIYMMPPDSDDERDVHPKMESLARRIMSETGEKSCLVPKGGANLIGCFGSMAIFDELYNQGALDRFDDVMVACGSSGTASGICIANYLAGSPLRVHGVLVRHDPEFAHDHVNSTLRQLGVEGVRSEDIFSIIDTYQGEGYSISKQEELGIFPVRADVLTGFPLESLGDEGMESFLTLIWKMKNLKTSSSATAFRKFHCGGEQYNRGAGRPHLHGQGGLGGDAGDEEQPRPLQGTEGPLRTHRGDVWAV
ncbi:bifunctional D-cysteine desulfhydrase/1-aminocyclopropane-1-carboxylate deaminase, mitochondrial-like isoform X1 [Haliotis rufescens]|uniref:bifunctional D-cysteine desulfhydrase/1-aminocyclopropane-1-carboxylate deaminase, mitochondrial-like isoform X1 n=1 Tax=Haliotis rufescens TaxID=6454 RepID=UPI00201F699A|nr:bifunctional D-cysteine desulfhydrase/1-aminocyclopropane-1-carboxylate deaminase, mitochondrial-like isoform X1 [Haliotis rufescens]